MNFIKAHAYGNDFLFVQDDDGGDDPAARARALCERHTGVGADGLIVYRVTPAGAAMRLYNADGSLSEVSGNGVRCLAAILVRSGHLSGERVPGTEILIETDAGAKRLVLLGREGGRYTFRAAMGVPGHPEAVTLDVLGEALHAVVLAVGNPQCVVLGPLDEARMNRLGPALEHHSRFPARTNVEFAEVAAPDRVRILIWERGVGPTRSSGTGSCAAAVAAAAFGGAGRDVLVEAPGGTQRVEWRADGLYLTGWAEVVCSGRWEAGRI